MRRLPILTAGAVALALAAPAMAAPDGARACRDRSEPMARADMMAAVDQRFAAIDTNGDGSIDPAEMTARRKAMRAARAEKLAALSEEDRARMEERRAAMKERKAQRPAAGDTAAQPRARGGWLARLDTDGNGLITKEEFAARDVERFERLDADGDGIVTPQERSAGRRAARG